MKNNSTQYVTIANGAIGELDEIITRLGASRLFFVIDKPAYEFSGAAKALENCLKKHSVVWFSDFEPNPKLEDVAKGIKLFRQNPVDAVVALGGGSALDMAKLISVCAVQEGEPLEYIKGERTLSQQRPSLIVIPTTAGTGSEATHFAVVYVAENKYSLADPLLLPEYILIDPQLTYTLPPKITAASGLDALSQAIESIWSVGATDESINYASEALTYSLDHLETTVNKPTPESRMAMAKAAYLAGKAINISKTTAPHALSYAITTHYHVPHGIAVALTLSAFLDYNYHVDDGDSNDPSGANEVKKRIDHIVSLFGNDSIEQAQNRLRLIKERIGCPLHLKEVGIKKENLFSLAGQVNAERLSNNPRKIDDEGLYELLNSVL